MGRRKDRGTIKRYLGNAVGIMQQVKMLQNRLPNCNKERQDGEPGDLIWGDEYTDYVLQK